MILEELAYQEDDLHSKVIDLYHEPESQETIRRLKEIFLEYKEIHRQYADLASCEIEALKRGLFIQWYALSEPNYLTGISDLEEEAENKILDELNSIIATSAIDNELVWMVNYYAKWTWIFERLKSFRGFDENIVNDQNGHLPKGIDRKAMERRGQMGKYWNSLTIFEQT